jgi:hypothetical protein
MMRAGMTAEVAGRCQDVLVLTSGGDVASWRESCFQRKDDEL